MDKILRITIQTIFTLIFIGIGAIVLGLLLLGIKNIYLLVF